MTLSPDPVSTPDTAVSDLLKREVVDAGVAPGASACVAVWREQRWWSLCGSAGRLKPTSAEPVIDSTPFDLASITKSVVAVAVAHAVERGFLRFDSPLCEILPWTASTPAGRLSIELLLAHRAGFVAHRELFHQEPLGSATPHRATAFKRGILLEACQALRPETLPNIAPSLPTEGFEPLYSDLGYILLGACLEEATPMPLHRWIGESLHALGGAQLACAEELLSTPAATEFVVERGGYVQGAVHDENAWTLAGTRCAGHAGLFGTAAEVTRFGTQLLECVAGSSSALSAASLDTLLRTRPGGSLRAGFDGKSSEASSVGNVLGSRTFGHLGFTGTSLWCDPEQGLVVCLLTNRVCPSRENPLIRGARPRVHDELARIGLAARNGRSSDPLTETVNGKNSRG